MQGKKKITKTCPSLELFVVGPGATVVYHPLHVRTEYFWGPYSESGGTDLPSVCALRIGVLKLNQGTE